MHPSPSPPALTLTCTLAQALWPKPSGAAPHQVLRILRVLRPLRLLQRDPGMKLVITSLIKTMPSVVDVTAVVLVFHLVS